VSKLAAICLIWLAMPASAQHRIDLFAGGSLRSGSPAREVALSSVNGISRDPSGNVVFTEQNANVIRRIASDGRLETIAGTGETGFSGDGGAATRAAMFWPSNPRYDAAGNLYFADEANARIRRVDPRGVITTIAGTGVPLRDGMDLEGPALERSIGWVEGMAVTGSGIVYFSERETNAIRRVVSGRLEVVAGAPQDRCYCSDGDGGPAAAAHLSAPGSIALDPAGNLYVIENFGHVRRITPDGTIDRYAGYGPQPPFRGTPPPDEGIAAIDMYIQGRAPLATGPDGSLYVADPGFVYPARIRRIDLSGIVNTVPGGSRIATADLAVGPDGSIALVRLGEVSVLADGVVTSVAGGAPKPAPDGIPARDAWLLTPIGIAASSTGDLYIAENGSCSVRKVGADGVLRTAAGTGNCGGPNDLAPVAGFTIDTHDRLCVSDHQGHFYRIAPDGSMSSVTLPPSIGSVVKLAVDAKDRVYVLGMFSLGRVSPDGKIEVIVNPPSSPGVPPAGFGPTSLRAIGTDPSGNVYFTGTYLGEPNDSVFRVNDDGSFTRVYRGSQNAWALAVDSAGRVWQADSGVSVIDATGSRSLGLAAAGYAGDGGPLQSARMQAVGIALSPSGDVFLLDGSRIRRITGEDPKARPAIAAVVNAVSYAGGAIAPGEIISIFGSGFALPGLAVNPVTNNWISTALGHTRVSIGGLFAPILAATPTQINAIVPSSVTPGKPVQVFVQFDTAASPPVSVPVAESAFGVATLDASGSGQGAILNQDGSVNSAANPAARGSVVSLFGVGVGASAPELWPGSLVISTPYPKPAATVTATIGGQPAELLYAGAAPFLAFGVTQINARIPAGSGSGAQQVVVQVNGISSRAVTVAVR
jgi:uncharacterized protein (TIGR03437 family)